MAFEVYPTQEQLEALAAAGYKRKSDSGASGLYDA
jgi:hypothetical protein